MPDAPYHHLKITRYFAEILHAPVVNPAWSWGAESQTSRALFFRIWVDHIDGGSVQVAWPWVAKTNGGLERRRHLDLMKSGRPTFGVICTAVKTNTGGKKRTIKKFEKQEFLRLGLPMHEDENGVLWATIEDQVTLAQLMQISGMPAAVKDDVQKISDDETLDETTKQRLVDARLGQGKFRARLFAKWDSRCAVTGSTIGEALRASHIVPWSLSDNKERLDDENGILLNAGIDALFDRCLVTFNNDGEMLISKSIPKSERSLLGLDHRKLRKLPSTASKIYLARHRALFKQEEVNRPHV